MAHIQCSFYSNSLKKNANVMVFIPTMSADDYLTQQHINYYRQNAKYQTLYLLHGSYGDCTDWVRLANIERYAQEKTLAVVMPSAENSSYVNMDRGEAYLNYISEELPAFLSKVFPLSRRREHTFIAGLSMGGYGAFRVAFEHPEQYGCAASLSGGLDMAALQNSTEAHMTLMPQNYIKAVFSDKSKIASSNNDLPTLLRLCLKKGVKLPQLYMTCGTEDFIYPTNETFYRQAEQLGINVQFERHHGVHNWDYWDAHIRDVLNWLPTVGDLVND
ncbi:alpha/beta hydrolase [Acetanaerobacterium elongatum]|uniref:S-formylglutathione hydrolase FrmB n=1 Tax=Acetanaerobacterium elongatum TaxID=258515 RepID=A0A1G9USF5_9FIRM|nr:alpha/beta hydrolase family protein [Acetanaerobacterium elongatum]SDM62813.1 S-formylglutathione hydrolase FrmB [Acetanaerobacterium elongatum]